MTASLPSTPSPPSFAKISLPSPPAPFSVSSSVRLPQTVKSKPLVSQPPSKQDSIEGLPQPFSGAIADPVPSQDVEAKLIRRLAEKEETETVSSSAKVADRSLTSSIQHLPVPPAPPAARSPVLPASPSLPEFAAIALPTAPKSALGASAQPVSVSKSAVSKSASIETTQVETISPHSPESKRAEVNESKVLGGIGMAAGASAAGVGAIAAARVVTPETSEVPRSDSVPQSENELDTSDEAELVESKSEVSVAIKDESTLVSEEAIAAESKPAIADESSAPEPSVTDVAPSPEVVTSTETDDDDRLTGEEIFAVIFALVVFAFLFSLFFFDDTFGFGSGRRLDELPRPEILAE